MTSFFHPNNAEVWSVQLGITQAAYDGKKDVEPCMCEVTLHKSPVGGWFFVVDGELAIDDSKELHTFYDELQTIAKAVGWEEPGA